LKGIKTNLNLKSCIWLIFTNCQIQLLLFDVSKMYFKRDLAKICKYILNCCNLDAMLSKAFSPYWF